MAEIKCPHCGKQFTVSESEYESVVSQIKNSEFEKEVERRLHEIEKTHETEVKLKVAETERNFEKKLSKAQTEISTLSSELKSVKAESDAKVKEKELEIKSKYQDEISKINEAHDSEKKSLVSELEYYKDLKAKASTKMIGESLEQHCMNEFNKLRMTAFRNDYFEKDNEVSESGSKGDFIYRAKDDTGMELLSIMFEMKNEMETTEKKHKNEDFFKELDKDRKEKGCEYAVLVTMLEADNDYYNQGIVDVSYRYDKMYVIRPQFFISLISILRNAALSQVELRHEVEIANQNNIDVVNFEKSLNDFKAKFTKNTDLATRKFNETLDEIDKAISHLQKTRDALTSCMRNINYADNKLEDVTMKRLCKGNETVTEMCKEAGIDV